MTNRIIPAVALLILLFMVGCADRRISVSYAPPSDAPRLVGAAPVAVYRFADRRDVEGIDRDIKAGGVYGGYGNKLSTVLVDTPVVVILQRALVAGFQARGIDAARLDTERGPMSKGVNDVFAVTGDLKDFSVEQRNTLAGHVRAVVRLHDADGRTLLEKEISERTRWRYDPAKGEEDLNDAIQDQMNLVLRNFVQRVVTDPEITSTMGLR